MRDMKRVTIDTHVMKQKNAFLRVRDEGTKLLSHTNNSMHFLWMATDTVGTIANVRFDDPLPDLLKTSLTFTVPHLHYLPVTLYGSDLVLL